MCFTKRCRRLKNTVRANWCARWTCCCAATSGWSPADLTNRSCYSKHWCRLSRRRQQRLKYLSENVNAVGKLISIGREKFRLRENRGPRKFYIQPRLQNAAGTTVAKGLRAFHH